MDQDITLITCSKCGAKNRVPTAKLQERPLCGKCRAPLAVHGKENLTVQVTDGTFAREVLASAEPVLLVLWAPWCAYCRMLLPITEQVARDFEGRVKVARMNIDENRAVPAQYTVQGVPTMLLFRDGKLMDRMVGVLSKEEIERHLKALVRSS
ncbi:MAG TPA: thioredoxin domain-containing protein [Syntrophales bacterium]|nr:thioredoxin domain-containing protein [Syntrophales bacterium]HOX93513.1 thioredoxin domain-containing protein [Syntrophales bacterium]HPI56018.1 thioredoxin domain-containing protein [Syntrophales bacterium]HPN24092.1 thioredoxin domain-containing protein [Syntrophales bacterium]HQM28371.1 thioredoxin domain-containing protein [Syntrophales bacterium]